MLLSPVEKATLLPARSGNGKAPAGTCPYGSPQLRVRTNSVGAFGPCHANPRCHLTSAPLDGGRSLRPWRRAAGPRYSPSKGGFSRDCSGVVFSGTAPGSFQPGAGTALWNPSLTTRPWPDTRLRHCLRV